MSLRLPLLVSTLGFAAILLAASHASAGPPDIVRDCVGCPDMVVVPAGTVMMGSPAGEPGRNDDEGPQHSVTIAHAFAVGRIDVTRAQYGLFIAERGGDAVDPNCAWSDPKSHGESFHQGPDEPVVCVSWADAAAYAAWLSARTRHTYRLLGEAEWEYAARAGSTAARPWGAAITHDDANIGVDACCGAATAGHDVWRFTSPGGSFPPNRFGLYDMIGDVWQWTQDCAYDYADPTNRDCTRRLIRGGSWFHGIDFARSAARIADDAQFRHTDIGFRVARDLDR